jgi:ornithine carbamoyltransferase
MKKDFVSIRDFTTDEILQTFDLAEDMKAQPLSYRETLVGKSLAMIFEKPSLRTRVSFDVGIRQLGGCPVCLLPQEINLGSRESVYDVAKTLERMVQGIMIRTFDHRNVVDIARWVSIPVINGLSDFSHPCQAMGDYFTIREVKGRLQGLRLAYVGDGNNVAHSLMCAGARLGVNVTIACPPGYEPSAIALDEARSDASASGATITIVHDPAEAVRSADVVYTDVWASMGKEKEAAERKNAFHPYQVNSALMKRAKADAIFMHCLPAHRGDEVTDDVIDAPSSVVFQQAENRLHVQKAIMAQLMRNR